MISKSIDIWEGLTYEDSGNSGFRPKLKTYILDGDKKRPAVLIFPGGGYNHTSLREGEPIAVNYNAAGFSSFVLNYSVYPNRYPQPLLDAARAISIIRQNADEWNIDKGKIAVCGFSAGGHLAALLGVYFDKEVLLNVKGINKEFIRPNALILGYPVITSGEFAHRGSFECLLGENADEKLLHYMSVEKHVSEKTPKSFIWHTFSDSTVPVQNSIMYAEALRKYNVSFELHIYPEGRHGMALCTKETDNGGRLNLHAASWFKLSVEWLENIFK
ncbi:MULTISPECIES: alpha/beta hydrolase [Clostridium]|uniref:alpha/beta hydrolase n=1 Tax=Clostridium TaxID=1485 RepID=UPI000824B26B|nr:MULTISPECIES: alpha/beta hydrolase [Clostridium]PJI09107.1 alpha/beta hydrolase [Clostridium sp. CT7]